MMAKLAKFPKTTGVGGEARGYDGAKKVRQEAPSPGGHGRLGPKGQGPQRQGSNQDGIRVLLESACEHLPHLSHLWVDAGYQGRGKEWAEEVLGLSVEVVQRTPKPTP